MPAIVERHLIIFDGIDLAYIALYSSELSLLALLAVVEQEFLWNSVETTRNNAVADFDRLNQLVKCLMG